MTLDEEARAKSTKGSYAKRIQFARENASLGKRQNRTQAEREQTLQLLEEKTVRKTCILEEDVQRSPDRERTNTPTARRGFLLRANPVAAQDTVSAPAIQIDIGQDRTKKRKPANKSEINRVDQTTHQEGTLREHIRMYIPILVKTELGSS